MRLCFDQVHETSVQFNLLDLIQFWSPRFKKCLECFIFKESVGKHWSETKLQT